MRYLSKGALLREKEERSWGRRTIAEVVSVNKDGTVYLNIYKNSSAIGGETIRLLKDIQHEFEIICLAEDRRDLGKEEAVCER